MPDQFGWDNNFGNKPASTRHARAMARKASPPANHPEPPQPLGTCECGGQIVGVTDFGRLFTVCMKCSPAISVSRAVADKQGAG